MMDFLFFATVAAFLTHELDAVRRHEWRVLPLTSFLPERTGEQVFIWSHLPLVLAILLVDGNSAGWFRFGFCAFAVIHVWLHWIYRRHPANEFNNMSSWSLILLTGALGGAYLAVDLTA